jgi:hypothetical protein
MLVAATKLSPQLHVPMSTRTYTNGGRSKFLADTSHAFESATSDRLLSPGFSMNKSTAGLFVITSTASCHILRLEVDDVIVAVDGHVLSGKHTLDDVVCLLEEPIGTSAQLTLLKQSGGTAGVVRKSAHFLRNVGLQSDGKFDLSFDSHGSDGDTQLDAAHLDANLQVDSRDSAYLYDADEEIECHSEHSHTSRSTSSQGTLSSSKHELSFAGADVGLAFRLEKISNEFCYIVDFIAQESPADHCGQIDGKLVSATVCRC